MRGADGSPLDLASAVCDLADPLGRGGGRSVRRLDADPDSQERPAVHLETADERAQPCPRLGVPAVQASRAGPERNKGNLALWRRVDASCRLPVPEWGTFLRN